MKAMYLAFGAMIVITIGANYALHEIGMSTADQGSTSSTVRLD